MDDARMTNSRRATEGCADRTWQAWRGVVAKIPAKRFAQVHLEEGDDFLDKASALFIDAPDGYLASLAVDQCAVLAGKDDRLSHVLGAALRR